MTDDRQNELLGHYENTVGEVGRLLIQKQDIIIPIYTIAVYAQLMDTTHKTVRRWIDEGKLIGLKVGRVWYVQEISFARCTQALDELPF